MFQKITKDQLLALVAIGWDAAHKYPNVYPGSNLDDEGIEKLEDEVPMEPWEKYVRERIENELHLDYDTVDCDAIDFVMDFVDSHRK